MLAIAIKNVRKFYDTYEILPSIRITNNKKRLGSAKITNGAVCTRKKYSRSGEESWNKAPVFQISIAMKECTSDDDINNVLYHEVIHCVHGCFNHGKKFKAVAAKINQEYGVKVESTKKPSESAAETIMMDNKELYTQLAANMGKKFKIRNKTYKFVGFNGRPKNCCDLVDAKGNQYVCSPIACAQGLKII